MINYKFEKYLNAVQSTDRKTSALLKYEPAITISQRRIQAMNKLLLLLRVKWIIYTPSTKIPSAYNEIHYRWRVATHNKVFSLRQSSLNNTTE